MVKLVNVPIGDAKAGETAPRVNGLLKNEKLPISRPIGTKGSTLYEFVDECLSQNPNRKVMGQRDLIDIVEKKKTVKKLIDGKETDVEKTWLYYQLSDYKYITNKQLGELIHSYGKGLVEIGLKHSNEERLHVFASTSAKWMQTFLAATSQSIPIVTAYDTLGEKGLTYSILQTETKAVFTDNALICKLVNPLKQAKDVRYIIHTERLDPEDRRQNGKLYSEANDAKQEILKQRPDVQFYSVDEVIALGRASAAELHLPKPEDVACIMYTSGSTGDPKGVVLSHQNILAGVAGVGAIIDRGIVTPKDRIIAFLPLAHIFELTFELLIFYWGGTIGYASVKTLTDNSMKDCLGDMRTFKPTIMVAVAAVWETIKKGIVAKISAMPTALQKVFWAGYKSKQVMASFHIPGSFILDRLLFSKIKDATGGQLRLVLNGGSPISQDTQEFISTLIAPMLIGYGLTETVANTSVVRPDHFEIGVQGILSGSIKVKLVDVEELGYFAKNNQGEIWIQGYPVTKEYFKNPDETAKAITPDGWFQTGDVGEWTSTGQLRVIDRKKNLVKTLNGEYIALEKIEAIYRSNPLVGDICCYADQNKVKPIAIVAPNPDNLAKLAVSQGLVKSQHEFELSKWVNDNKLRNAVTKSLVSQGKKDGLNGIELILGSVLVDHEWTPQNGFVTSAHKLQRKKILQSVQNEVDQVYKINS